MKNSLNSRQEKHIYLRIINNIFLGILAAFILFSLRIGYDFAFYTPPRISHTNRQIYKIIRYQRAFYMEHNTFADKYRDLSIEEQISPQDYFEIEMKKLDNELIGTIHDTSIERSLEKASFGIIEPILEKQFFQLNQGKNLQQYHFSSSICTNDKRGISQLSNTAIADFFAGGITQCPEGYTQYVVDRDLVYLPRFNIESMLEKQLKDYQSQQKFAKRLPEDPYFVANKLDNYQYQIQATSKQVIISTKPKFWNKKAEWTYLAIAEAKDGKQKERFITRYCGSDTHNIPIPNISEIVKISKGCPTGYKPQ